MKINLSGLNFFALLAVALMMFSGCAVKKLSMSMASKVLTADGGTLFSGDEDPQLVGDALPLALKLHEAVLAKRPSDWRLLLATGKGFCMYSYAYIQTPAERLTFDYSREQERIDGLMRAKRMYLRSRQYLLSGLDVRHPGFTTFLSRGMVDSALALTDQADTSLLYWAGAAWMAALTADKFDVTLIADMFKPVMMVQRVLTLNPGFGAGSAYEFLMSYFGGLPPSMGGSEKLAREYCDSALANCNLTKASPYIGLATTVCVRNQNVAEFKELLNKALTVDLEKGPQNKLANILSKQRAQFMLNNIDNLFLETGGAR